MLQVNYKLTKKLREPSMFPKSTGKISELQLIADGIFIASKWNCISTSLPATFDWHSQQLTHAAAPSGRLVVAAKPTLTQFRHAIFTQHQLLLPLPALGVSRGIFLTLLLQREDASPG